MDTSNEARAVGGSVASSLHGFPRSTMDVDFVAAFPSGCSEKFVAALKQGVLGPLCEQLTVLDDDVALNARAARGLIEHRDGPDGDFGTSDDDPFDSLEEVDAVLWVGPVAIRKLRESVLGLD